LIILKLIALAELEWCGEIEDLNKSIAKRRIFWKKEPYARLNCFLQYLNLLRVEKYVIVKTCPRGSNNFQQTIDQFFFLLRIIRFVPSMFDPFHYLFHAINKELKPTLTTEL
jgi:hypothetical protein